MPKFTDKLVEQLTKQSEHDELSLAGEDSLSLRRIAIALERIANNGIDVDVGGEVTTWKGEV